MFILPILVCLLFLIIYFDKRRNIVESVAISWLFITSYTWVVVELFSGFGLLNTAATLPAWSVLCIALAVYVGKKHLIHRTLEYFKTEQKMADFWSEHKTNLICMFLFCTGICLLAALRSQNLIDNLEHRLPKIMHWLQNGRVGYFATVHPAEINYTKLIEYMTAQVYLLLGPDRLANIVQVGAYLCSGCCIYGISRKIGVSCRFAFLASWIYFLTPMIIIEVFTAQTDVAAGAYLLTFVYFLLDFIHADKLQMNRSGAFFAVCLSASVMFGFLAKPTVCFAMVFFFLWMCIVRIVRKDKLRVLLQYIVVGGVVAVILFFPDAVRDYQYNQIPDVSYDESAEDTFVSTGTGNEESGGDQRVDITDDSDRVVDNLLHPKNFVIVCVRNLAANATTRCFPKINEWLVRFVEKCESVLNYSGGYRYFRVLVGEGIGETSEPSPVVMFLLLFAWILVIVRVSRVNREQFIYLFIATLALIVQAGLMSYSWFRQRYLIGAMAVLCPAFAVVLENVTISIKSKLSLAIAIITVCCFGTVNMLSYEIPYVISGLHGGKLHQYLLHNDSAELYYRLMLDYINENGYETAGMYGFISYEQVLWRGIDDLERLEHININPFYYECAKLEDQDYVPQCIIEEMPDVFELEETIYCNGQKYVCVWKAEGDNGRNYAVLTPYEANND